MQPINVIVETPKGSAHKYDFDFKTGYLKLKKVMPTGMVFPFDFGFIEGTIGEDGDPLDVIVIAEFKTFPGCALDCRIIGAIKATQKERNGKKVRNDRFIAIPEVSILYKNVNSFSDFPRQTIEELEAFFESYNEQAGKKFKPFERISSKKALALIAASKNKSQVKTKLIQLFLPCETNKGKPYPASYFEEVKKTLIDKFNGLTTYAHQPVLGNWKQNAKLVNDKLIIFEVMGDNIETSFWKKYKLKLQKKFKQEDIVIRCSEITSI